MVRDIYRKIIELVLQAAELAAPKATTSSGLTLWLGSLPKNLRTASITAVAAAEADQKGEELMTITTAQPGIGVNLEELQPNQSVSYGDGKTFHLLHTRVPVAHKAQIEADQKKLL